MRLTKLAAGFMSLAMAMTMLPATALAANEQSGEAYVLMNIPYAQFYEAEVNNDVPVDAFTSATKNKTRTASLAGGSYHVNADGTDTTGVTFPVKVSNLSVLSGYKEVTDSDSVDITVTNRGNTTTTTYKGSEALFENPSYSYYVLDSKPTYYKELSVDGSKMSFGKTVGRTASLGTVDTELYLASSYGDYQLSVDGITDYVSTSDQVYGVVIGTKEGNSYGLRHLENIWRVSELAWCTGYTDSVHNCPTSSDHYKKMMGQTINKITYYTSRGIYTMDANVKVMKKSAENTYEAQVGDAPFYLSTKADSYKCDSDKVVKVDAQTGKVTIVGAGTAKIDVTVTSHGATTTTPITINVAPKPLTAQNISVTKSAWNVTQGDKAFSLGAKAKTALSYKSSNTKVVKVSSTGKVTIVGTGKAVITISAAANETYSGAAKKVTVNVAKYKLSKQTAKVKAGKKKIAVSWKKNVKATGYQVFYGTKKNFKGAKKVTVKTNKTTKLTIKKLKSKKIYYVRVRSYKKLGSKYVYGSYSAIKKIRVK